MTLCFFVLWVDDGRTDSYRLRGFLDCGVARAVEVQGKAFFGPSVIEAFVLLSQFRSY
jgi:hypothetical protein